MELQMQSRGYKIFRTCNYIAMLFVIAITVVPYLNIAAQALHLGERSSGGGASIASWVSFRSFRMLFGDSAILQAAFISVTRVALHTLLSLIVIFTCSYVMSKKSFPFKSGILIILVIPMFIHAGLIPNYVFYSKIGLLNSYWVYIMPTLFSFFNMTLIRTYIRSAIPDSLEESARMDGAGELTVMLRIIFPLCTPILAAIALFEAVNSWNDWTTTLYYVTNPDLFTLQYKLMQIIKESESLMKLMAEAALHGQDTSGFMSSTSSESLIAAQIVVTTVPIIIVYPFLQKYFVNGIMIGAVKE